MNKGNPHKWWSDYLRKQWAEHRDEMIERCKRAKIASTGFKGRKHSEETKRKIADKLKAEGMHPPWQLSPMHKKGCKAEDILGKEKAEKRRQALVLYNQNKVVSAATRIKMSEKKRGVNNPGWKGGVKTEREQIRNSWQLKGWRWAVFTRDNFTCQKCGSKEKIQAHHIKEFAYSSELRFDVSNGITLCKKCHSQTDSYGGKWKRGNRMVASESI